MERVRVECELHVAAAFDLQRADDFQCAVAQHVIFLVGQRLRRADYDGIARVNADRIKIFHVADGDGGVVFVAHHFVFDFLKTFDAFFDEHLVNRRQGECIFHQFLELFRRLRKTAARAAERKCRAKHHRKPDVFHGLAALFHR